MKLLLLACLLAVYTAKNCTNPMLNHTDNPFLVNITVLNDSIIAPDDIPVCKPLRGKRVCCSNDSFTQMQTNFERVKDRYKEFVERRKARIENITKEFRDLD